MIALFVPLDVYRCLYSVLMCLYLLVRVLLWFAFAFNAMKWCVDNTSLQLCRQTAMFSGRKTIVFLFSICPALETYLPKVFPVLLDNCANVEVMKSRLTNIIHTVLDWDCVESQELRNFVLQYLVGVCLFVAAKCRQLTLQTINGGKVVTYGERADCYKDEHKQLA